MTKKINAKLIAMFFCVFLIMMLTGCVNMSTKIEINSEKFSGERVMSVTFDKDELLTRLPGGTDELNALINDAIPKSLTYKFEEKDDDLYYNFTLSFESKQDYIDKLKDLLNKAPEVKFTYSSSVFTKGVTFNENFESRELFGWFDKLITENGLVTSSQKYSSDKFWNQTEVKVILDGEEYTCEGGKVDIMSGGKSVVSDMTISTDIKASGDIERTILIVIPSSVEKSQITLIDNYLNDNVPDSGSWSKRNRSNNTIYTIKFTAGSTAKLENYMSKLTNGKCKCSIDNVQDLSQPLADSRTFSEYIDFSYLGGESTVPVTYGVSSEDGAPYQINLDDGKQEKNADATADGSKLVCKGEFNSIKFKTVLRKMSHVDLIEYNLIQSGDNKFTREVIITLAKDTNPTILDNISNYYTIKGAGNTNIIVENNDVPTVKIYIIGNAKQLIAAEAVLFGGVGARALDYDSNWGIYSLHPNTKLIDSFDITSLISLMNVSKFAYSYSYDGNNVTRITSTVDGQQEFKDIQNEDNVDYDFVYVALGNGIQTITIDGYYFNGWAVFFYVLTALFFIALIALAALVYLYKTGKIKLPINDKQEPIPDPKPLYTPIPAPMPEPQMPTIPEPMPEPEPIPLPVPEPRDLTENFDDEPPSEPIMLFNLNKEPEPETNPTHSMTSEPNMEPVISYPEKYHPTDEFAAPSEQIVMPSVTDIELPPPEPVVPESQQIDVPPPTKQELPPRETPNDYTDDDMIDDFDVLGLLGEYKRHIQKVKVKVRKMKNDDESADK